VVWLLMIYVDDFVVRVGRCFELVGIVVCCIG